MRKGCWRASESVLLHHKPMPLKGSMLAAMDGLGKDIKEVSIGSAKTRVLIPRKASSLALKKPYVAG